VAPDSGRSEFDGAVRCTQPVSEETAGSTVVTERERLRHAFELTVEDLVSALTYYDRKEDEDLTLDDIAALVRNDWVTADEASEWFRSELAAAFDGIRNGTL
jgi:hypothetical protein